MIIFSRKIDTVCAISVIFFVIIFQTIVASQEQESLLDTIVDKKNQQFTFEDLTNDSIKEIFAYLPKQDFPKMHFVNKKFFENRSLMDGNIAQQALYKAKEDIRSGIYYYPKNLNSFYELSDIVYGTKYKEYYVKCFPYYCPFSIFISNKQHEPEEIVGKEKLKVDAYKAFVRQNFGITVTEPILHNRYKEQNIKTPNFSYVYWICDDNMTLDVLCNTFKDAEIRPKRIIVRENLFEEIMDKLLWTSALPASLERTESSLVYLIQNVLLQSFSNGYTLLHQACSNETPNIVQFLLENGVERNVQCANGNTPLHCVIDHPNKKSRQEITTLLLKHRVDLEIEGEYGHTPLHDFQFWPQLAQLLIQAGANLESKNRFGLTPLQTLIGLPNFWETGRLLIEAGAKLDVKKDLHNACLFGNLQAVEDLIEAGIDVDTLDNMGASPLGSYLLCDSDSHENKMELLRLLLDKGGRLDIPDKGGRTPLDYARYNRKARQLLDELGVKIPIDRTTILYSLAKLAGIAYILWLCHKFGPSWLGFYLK